MSFRFGSASPSTINRNQYETDYRTLNKNVFLGLILDSSNKITRAFACGLKDGTTPFCIRATSSGEHYNINNTLLQSSALWNNTCTVNENAQYVNCTRTSLKAYADANGNVQTYEGDGACFAYYNGNIFCN